MGPAAAVAVTLTNTAILCLGVAAVGAAAPTLASAAALQLLAGLWAAHFCSVNAALARQARVCARGRMSEGQLAYARARAHKTF